MTDNTDQNKAVVRRFYDEVLNQGAVAVLDEIAVENYVENDPLPGQGDGRADLRDRVGAILAAFSPVSFAIVDMIAEHDRVVVRSRSTGTHTDEFMGIPPTGRDYTINGIDVHRLNDGRMAEHWHLVDQLGRLLVFAAVEPPRLLASGVTRPSRTR